MNTHANKTVELKFGGCKRRLQVTIYGLAMMEGQESHRCGTNYKTMFKRLASLLTPSCEVVSLLLFALTNT